MGEIVALASALAWSATTIAMRPIAGRGLLHAGLLRMLVGSAILVAYAWPTGALERALAAPSPSWGWLLGSVLSSLVIGDSLFFLASSRIGVARALPIASSFPLFSTGGAVLLLGEPASPSLLAGTVLVVVGIAAIVGDRPARGERIDRFGLALAGLAALGWASTGLMLRPALDYLDPVAANVIRFPLAGAIFAVMLAARRPTNRLKGRDVWLAVLGGLGTVAAALLFLVSISMAGVARAVLLNATTPVFSALLAVWLLRERLTRKSALGITLCVLGSLLVVF